MRRLGAYMCPSMHVSCIRGVASRCSVRRAARRPPNLKVSNRIESLCFFPAGAAARRGAAPADPGDTRIGIPPRPSRPCMHDRPPLRSYTLARRRAAAAAPPRAPAGAPALVRHLARPRPGRAPGLWRRAEPNSTARPPGTALGPRTRSLRRAPGCRAPKAGRRPPARAALGARARKTGRCSAHGAPPHPRRPCTHTPRRPNTRQNGFHEHERCLAIIRGQANAAAGRQQHLNDRLAAVVSRRGASRHVLAAPFPAPTCSPRRRARRFPFGTQRKRTGRRRRRRLQR